MGLDVYMKAPVAGCHEELTVSTPTYYRLPCCHDHQAVDDGPGGSCRFCARCEKWIRPHKWDEDCITTQDVYSGNITHNLTKMAEAAGLYEAMWRPEEIGITKAKQLIEPLTVGLNRLTSAPKKYQKFNAPNGCGMYEHFVPFVREYLAACVEHPDADVVASR